MNGAACKLEAELLAKALTRYSQHRCFATCYQKLKEPSTFLCLSCQNLLLKSKMLEDKLYAVEQTIDSKLEILMTTRANSSTIPISSSEVPSASTPIPRTPTRKRSTSVSSSAMNSSPDVSVSACSQYSFSEISFLMSLGCDKTSTYLNYS